MNAPSFNWVRRWTPRDVDLENLFDRTGVGRGDRRPLAGWADVPCLVLLGEGGLGKSHELRTEQARLAAEGSAVYLCDLGRTTDRTALRDQVLPRIQPGQQVTVLIDGFDEVFDDVNDIAEVLGDYVGDLDRSSVSVRIASRPVVWSTRLEAHLAQLWAADEVMALTLEPVTADDIRAAAETQLSGPQVVEFMRIISDQDLWSLASSPITLRFLLDRFRRSGTLDDDRLAIHRDGITQLAAEQDPRRLDRRRQGPPVADRISAAQKLAYLSMFGGKPLIETRRSASSSSKSAPPLRQTPLRDEIALVPPESACVWEQGVL